FLKKHREENRQNSVIIDMKRGDNDGKVIYENVGKVFGRLQLMDAEANLRKLRKKGFLEQLSSWRKYQLDVPVYRLNVKDQELFLAMINESEVVFNETKEDIADSLEAEFGTLERFSETEAAREYLSYASQTSGIFAVRSNESFRQAIVNYWLNKESNSVQAKDAEKIKRNGHRYEVMVRLPDGLKRDIRVYYNEEAARKFFNRRKLSRSTVNERISFTRDGTTVIHEYKKMKKPKTHNKQKDIEK
ncbi:MAG: hypothetical protein MI702_01085, partial [Chlorobiales bacterium]|nr:hypothetical protein [Chlorobiales bacterium]